MFGGVDQLLRQAQGGDDWWINDQRQLATGFSHWPTDYDASSWSTTVTQPLQSVSPSLAQRLPLPPQQHAIPLQQGNGRSLLGTASVMADDGVFASGFGNNQHTQSSYYFPGEMEYPDESEWYQ
jgi:hypothetical protein